MWGSIAKGALAKLCGTERFAKELLVRRSQRTCRLMSNQLRKEVGWLINRKCFVGDYGKFELCSVLNRQPV